MLVLATSTSVTIARKKAFKNIENDKHLGTTIKAGKNDKNLRTNFAQVLCIWYPIVFEKKFVLALFDLGSKVNIIYPTFINELELFVREIDVKA